MRKLDKIEGLPALTTEEESLYLNECFRYDNVSGKLYWREDRPLKHFKEKRNRGSWLSRHSGREVGNPDKVGYRVTCLNKRKYKVHRIVFRIVTGHWPLGKIDHINGVKGDNRFENLRDVSPTINSRNAKKSLGKTTGISGISYRKGRKHSKPHWTAYGNVDGVYVHLCNSKNFFEACCVRISWLNSQKGYTERHGRL